MVIAPVVRLGFEEVDSLKPTSRGIGGFGSTGTAEVQKPGKDKPGENSASELFENEYALENDVTMPGGSEH
jgi:hypothetical protein